MVIFMQVNLTFIICNHCSLPTYALQYMQKGWFVYTSFACASIPRSVSVHTIWWPLPISGFNCLIMWISLPRAKKQWCYANTEALLTLCRCGKEGFNRCMHTRHSLIKVLPLTDFFCLWNTISLYRCHAQWFALYLGLILPDNNLDERHLS